jgi:uncharacterized repeat protein (TIGR01451 family)
MAGAWIVASALLLAATGAHAQVQRSFVNPSFEQPVLPGTACWSIRESADVPGWRTTEPPYTGSWGNSQHGTCGGHPDRPVIESMQIFKNGWTGMQAQHGEQWAELNAQTPSRLYQTVCLAPGERVDWSLAHRGRSGGERMSFNIGPNADGTGNVEILRAASNTVGAGTINACGAMGTCSYDGPVNTWATYSGNFIWSGSAGLQTIGFQSVTAGSTGNYLDNIQLTLRPYVEFFPQAVTAGEADGAADVPSIRVAGVIKTDFDVVVNITGGTAALGTDFTAPGPSFVVTIPAGDYGTGQDFPLPLSVIDDAVVEDNETVTLSIADDPANYAIGSTSACGAPANADFTWTIADNDVDLMTTKSVSDASPGVGHAFTYTVSYANNTARPTTAPLDAHDAIATITDPMPAGISFGNWTCTASGGASCPAASGTGAINASAVLPAGAAAAGGLLTYTITATLDDPASCDAITNVANIATPPGLAEGTSAQPGFDTPAPGGAANNSAIVDVTLACADLSITKSATPGDVQPGDEVAYTLLVGNAGPAAADGAVVTDPQPAGLDCSAGTLACGAEAGGAVCPASPTVPALQGSGLVIPTFPMGGSLQFTLTCTVTASGTP